MAQLIAWDHATFLAINGWQGSPFWDFVFLWGTELGAAYIAIPVGVLMARVAGARSWSRAWRAVIVGGSVSLVSASLKLVFTRPRPLATLQGVRVLGTPLYEFSFPSGHTLTAFAVVGVVMALNTRMGLMCVPFALFVGLSRVYVGAHFPTDVLVGALLGFIPTLLIGRRVLNG